MPVFFIYLGIFTNYLSIFVFLMLGARDSPAECGGSARKAAEENQNIRGGVLNSHFVTSRSL